MHIKCRRISESIKDIQIEMPKKSLITKDTSIFTMGSCFAREVRAHLIKKKYKVLNNTLSEELLWYNTFTMRDEFRRLTSKFSQDDKDMWFAKGTSKYQDPYRRLVFSKTSVNLLNLIREIDEKISGYIKKADVLIMTLGLTEVWFQAKNKKAICAVPGYPRSKGGGRKLCYFRPTSYQENMDNVDEIVKTLKKLNPTCQIIITVSPVALALTFRKMDHLVANTESKSILRAVAATAVSNYSNVHYFPSYELAMNYPVKKVFKADGRHVQDVYIDRIMSSFIDHFVDN